MRRFIKLREWFGKFPNFDQFIKCQMQKEGFSQEEIAAVFTPPATEREQLCEKILALEEKLMDAFESKKVRTQAELDVRIYLKWRMECTGLDLDKAQANWSNFNSAEARAKRLSLIEKPADNLGDYLETWKADMHRLCGTKLPDGSIPSPLARRHDGEAGAYGSKAISEEDCDNNQRTLIVIHGHGGWYRSGLLIRSQLGDTPKLVSLKSVLAKVNETRQGEEKVLLDPDKFSLAFVDHHGIPIMLGKVMKGGYPDRAPISPMLLQAVQEFIAETPEAKRDAAVLRKCKITLQEKENLKPKADRQKVSQSLQNVHVFRDSDSEAFWNAYQRVKKGELQGKPGEYADILWGGADGDTLFPDSMLGFLINFRQGIEQMKPARCDQYQVYTLDEDDIVPSEANTSLSVNGRLSLTLDSVLSKVDLSSGRDVRVVWAGCRSEQWPPRFGLEMFREWIREACESRAAARTEAQQERIVETRCQPESPDLCQKPPVSASVLDCDSPPLSTARVEDVVRQISASTPTEDVLEKSMAVGSGDGGSSG